MKRRTYNNMVKATKIIAEKGYEWDEANEIAIQCFNNRELEIHLKAPIIHDVEWFLDKIITNCSCFKCMYLDDNLFCPAFLTQHKNCKQCYFTDNKCDLFQEREAYQCNQ